MICFHFVVQFKCICSKYLTDKINYIIFNSHLSFDSNGYKYFLCIYSQAVHRYLINVYITKLHCFKCIISFIF